MNQTIQLTKDDKIRSCLDRIATAGAVFQLNGDAPLQKQPTWSEQISKAFTELGCGMRISVVQTDHAVAHVRVMVNSVRQMLVEHFIYSCSIDLRVPAGPGGLYLIVPELVCEVSGMTSERSTIAEQVTATIGRFCARLNSYRLTLSTDQVQKQITS